jgi:hypothetical protein
VLLLNESFKKQPYNLFGIEHGKEVSDKINSSIIQNWALFSKSESEGIAVSKEFYEKWDLKFGRGGKTKLADNEKRRSRDWIV